MPESVSPRVGAQPCAEVSVPVRESYATRVSALQWILRVGCAACFIGHGAFGIITKTAWVPYFAVWGIPEPWAWRLMPIVGAVDISIGILTLVQPIRAVILYMAFWGLQTAALRPLAGQGVWELLERAGNYGVPLAFLMVLGWGQSLRDWVSTRPAAPLTHVRTAAIDWTLRITTACLLIGHGAFDFAMHKDWSGYAASLGVTPATVAAHPLRPFSGWAEAALGLAVLAWPVPPVLVLAFVWKVGTEAVRPLAGEPIWEFIERGGSYAAPLALLMLRLLCGHSRFSIERRWRRSPDANRCSVAEAGARWTLVLALGTAAHPSSVRSASACSSQKRMSISRYMVVAVVRCWRACSRWPVRR
jgi:hypothetical protein